jgi:hypothetical protein
MSKEHAGSEIIASLFIMSVIILLCRRSADSTKSGLALLGIIECRRQSRVRHKSIRRYDLHNIVCVCYICISKTLDNHFCRSGARRYLRLPLDRMVLVLRFFLGSISLVGCGKEVVVGGGLNVGLGMMGRYAYFVCLRACGRLTDNRTGWIIFYW